MVWSRAASTPDRPADGGGADFAMSALDRGVAFL